MSSTEIILLVAGAVVFVLSFLLPAKKEENSQETKKLAKEEIKALVSQELESVRGHVDDVVEEAVGYAMEKTERSLERLSNEKIMAVNEYSDTVLKEIHKNHEEVMFLYDMLNDKHTNLKNAVTEVNKTVKEAEATVNTFQMLNPEPAAVVAKEPVKEEEPENKLKDGMDISFMPEPEEEGLNSNERILELYRQGKSKVAIAKELGLGVGEVKLVIDLYKNL
ncbi:MAG: DUF6115 domain-containing protein [Acetatifactor sp.]